MNYRYRRILFPPGYILATPGALDALDERALELTAFLLRHLSGDWGDLCAEDWATNNEAVKKPLRIFSSYKLDENQKLWVITEADRSATTFLLPEEY